MQALERVKHAVTAITGFSKGSGKTTFLSYLLPIARTAGPCALVSIGSDTSLGRNKAATSPLLHVEIGDVVITSLPLAKASSASFEILDTVAGRSQFGRLVVGRAVRAGEVSLLGAEHLSDIRCALDQILAEGWAHSVLIDGAVNRLTQVASLGHVQFIYTVRVDPASLAQVVSKLQMLETLAKLPHWSEETVAPSLSNASPVTPLSIEGPLTTSVVAGLPAHTPTICLSDFTKVFLTPNELSQLQRETTVYVRHPLNLICVSLALRNLTPAQFISHLSPEFSLPLLFNACQVFANETD